MSETEGRCPEHFLSHWCAACRADHHAGDHSGRPVRTCKHCQTAFPTDDVQRAAANDREDAR
ncbi:hypothetical protein [Isoptericola sp. NPDC055881]